MHGDEAQGSLPQFIVNNSTQAHNSQSQIWHPKITPYRLAVISTTLCLGTVKAVLTQQGKNIAPITIEWIMGVVFVLVWVLHHLTPFFLFIETLTASRSAVTTTPRAERRRSCLGSLHSTAWTLRGTSCPYFPSAALHTSPTSSSLYPVVTQIIRPSLYTESCLV